VLLDGHVSLLRVLHVDARDLSVLHLDGGGVVPLLVDHVVPVALDLLAQKLLPVVVVVGLLGLVFGRRESRAGQREDPEEGDDCDERALRTVHESSCSARSAVSTFAARNRNRKARADLGASGSGNIVSGSP